MFVYNIKISIKQSKIIHAIFLNYLRATFSILQGMYSCILSELYSTRFRCLCPSLAAGCHCCAACCQQTLIGFQFRKFFRAVRLCGAESWNSLSSCPKGFCHLFSHCSRIVDFNCERSGSSSSSIPKETAVADVCVLFVIGVGAIKRGNIFS